MLQNYGSTILLPFYQNQLLRFLILFLRIKVLLISLPVVAKLFRLGRTNFFFTKPREIWYLLSEKRRESPASKASSKNKRKNENCSLLTATGTLRIFFDYIQM